MNTMNKSWLDHLYYDIGRQWTDYRVCHTNVDGDGDVRFSKWMTYMEAQEHEYKWSKVNQRTLLNNEIALEFDGEWEDYLKLIKSLHRASMGFYAYATKGHRAKHIHLFFGAELAALTPYKRSIAREAFITKYGCDKALAGDNHMIALEHCPHWKTGEMKMPVEEVLQ